MLPVIATTAQSQSVINQLMKNYTGYNLWANTTLVNWLRSKPAELLEKEIASSFPSIRLTLHHIWQAQQYWLSVLQREAPKVDLPQADSVEDVLNGIVAQSEELLEYIQSVDDEIIEEKTLIVSPWFQSSFPNFEYIMHCMNHSTYHRGQIVTIARQLGFNDAPMTDYNFYNIHGRAN